MKKYTVRLTPRAIESINQIVDDLYENASVDYAAKVEQAIVDAIDGLQTMPNIHQKAIELKRGQSKYRRALVLDYKIVYTVNDDVLEVVVVQAYSQSRGQEWIDENV
jgi:plasmid stabilization system protein ParE